VAIGANIVFTFSEAVRRGSGNIVLKTAAGAVVATYDVASSTNLSISESTLSINPTADLSYSTGYKVELAAGSIKDIAGNSYAGVSDYNFSTVSLPTVSVSLTTAAVSESAASNLVYTFTRSGDVSKALTIDIGLSGTATAADYTGNYTSNAGTPWTKLFGSSGNDFANALTTGLDGSIYVGGWTAGALDGQSNSGGPHAFLTKYSADGTKIWTKRLSSTSNDWGNALTIGLDGSIYVGGWTDGALDGQANSGSWDAFLTKYGADGTKIWTKLLGSRGND
jgi:hypothetical protein